MLNSESPSVRSPLWWRTDHDSAWTRVKTALHRDWEQTKSDVTGGRKGTDLNQGVGDTLGQAFGNLPIPSDVTPNAMSDEERVAHVARAAKQMARTAEALEEDTEESIAKNQERQSSDWTRWSRWDEAEGPLRYGYSASSYYPASEWNEDTEDGLRSEWEALYPEQDWSDVRETVRHGWNHRRS